MVSTLQGHYQDSRIIAERTGHTRLLYTVLYNQALIALQQGGYEQALRLLRRSLALCLDMGVLTEAATALHALAGALGAAGEPMRAARLFGAAEAMLERHGTLFEPDDQPEHDRIVAAIRAQLGEADYGAAWTEGYQMPFDVAVENALQTETELSSKL